ncbi:Anti-sigma B factor RsbT [Minicystis rosea]|nr:Anti-sigma B factor RsbT [Minicystis rosea]
MGSGPTSPRRDAAEALDGFPLAALRELTKYLSEPNARALLYASGTAAGVSVTALKPSHLSIVVSQIVKTFDVFGIGADAKAKCLFNLRSLSNTTFPASEVVVPITSEGDIVTARESGKQMCVTLNFTEVSYVKVATAISELARNIVKYAGEGSITVRVIPGQRRGIEVVATDRGPGIPDIDAVLSPRYRSRSGMGIGLRGTKKVMDHFEIRSQTGRGTTVTIRKYQD